MSPTLAKEYWHLLEVDSVIQEWAEKWANQFQEYEMGEINDKEINDSEN